MNAENILNLMCNSIEEYVLSLSAKTLAAERSFRVWVDEFYHFMEARCPPTYKEGLIEGTKVYVARSKIELIRLKMHGKVNGVPNEVIKIMLEDCHVWALRHVEVK